MSNFEMELRIDGKAFNEEEGYNLYLLSKSLENFNSLLEKSYLTIANRQRMSTKDRELMKIKALDIRSGSFIADISITLLQTAPALLPIFTSQTPESIWHLTKNGILYLKAVLEENAKGGSFMTNIDENTGNVNVFNNRGDVIINNVHPDVFTYVEKAETNIENLTRMIDPKVGFDGIDIKDKNDREDKLFLGVKDKRLFEQKTKIEKDPITFYGEMYNIDGDDFKGKVRVYESKEEIEPGEYNFNVLNKDRDILRKSFLTHKKITALKETVFDPVTLKKKIIRLRIIDIE